jgi:hypothetical protein
MLSPESDHRLRAFARRLVCWMRQHRVSDRENALPSQKQRKGMDSHMEPISMTSNAARRTEDIALDLLKFLASHANLAGKSAGSTTGFVAPSSVKEEDKVAHLLELYARCREAVEAPIEK